MSWSIRPMRVLRKADCPPRCCLSNCIQLGRPCVGSRDSNFLDALVASLGAHRRKWLHTSDNICKEVAGHPSFACKHPRIPTVKYRKVEDALIGSSIVPGVVQFVGAKIVETDISRHRKDDLVFRWNLLRIGYLMSGRKIEGHSAPNVHAVNPHADRRDRQAAPDDSARSRRTFFQQLGNGRRSIFGKGKRHQLRHWLLGRMDEDCSSRVPEYFLGVALSTPTLVEAAPISSASPCWTSRVSNNRPHDLDDSSPDSSVRSNNSGDPSGFAECPNRVVYIGLRVSCADLRSDPGLSARAHRE